MDARFEKIAYLNTGSEYTEAKEIIKQLRIEASERCRKLLQEKKIRLTTIRDSLYPKYGYVKFECKIRSPILVPINACKEIICDTLDMSCHEFFFNEKLVTFVPAKAIGIIDMLTKMPLDVRDKAVKELKNIYLEAENKNLVPKDMTVNDVLAIRLQEIADEMDVLPQRICGDHCNNSVRARIYKLLDPDPLKRPLPRLESIMYFAYKLNKPFDFFVIYDYMQHVDTIYYYSPYKPSEIYTDPYKNKDTSYNLLKLQDKDLIEVVRYFTLLPKEYQIKMWQHSLKKIFN